MTRTAIGIIFALALIVGAILLQIYLSKKEGKWPGLVLPILAFLYGLLYPLNMVAPTEGMSVGFFVQVLLVWLVGNIPTIVFLAIYFSCRGKQRRNKQLEKMNIQDLG